MPPGASSTTGRDFGLARLSDLLLPIAIMAAVLVMLVPLPAALVDVLLAVNIGLAAIVLLTTMYVRTPLEFSVFPTLLLAATLGRLVLNVAVTRLILTRAGSEGLDAAGGVVRGFGEFVAGDKLVVGLVIFAILVVIQFVVITKGATRIGEVAARFALDGMPGRQMAIDADLNAGVIDMHEAQRRRQELTRQADFYGAMDGAGKFVRGDAVAAIVITLVNIVGGLFIGIVEDGMSPAEAASVFTRLTIGDGLVTQVPGLLISLAAGMLVTRSTSEVNLPDQFLSQIFSRPQALAVTGGFLGLLVFTDLPRIPLLAIGAMCAAWASRLMRHERQRQQAAAARSDAAAKQSTDERIEDYLLVDPMEIELGVGLIRLADPQRGGDLLGRVGRVRQNVAAELGIVMPKVRIRDNLRLSPYRYRIKLADVPVAEGLLQPGMLLAVDSGSARGRLEGTPTHDPAFGRPAVWIEPALRVRAEAAGYSVAEPPSVLTGHLAEVVRRHADELLTRDATRHLIDEQRKLSPAVVDELLPGLLKLAEVQQVLRRLLRERIAIRQLGPILEALGDHASRTKDPVALAEHVRRRLARSISARYRGDDGRLHVVTLAPATEEFVRSSFEQNADGLSVGASPDEIESLCRSVAGGVEPLVELNHPPILLVAPAIRAALREMLEPHLPQVVILSYQEITRDTPLESHGVAVLENESVSAA